jgi:hypothetical protein
MQGISTAHKSEKHWRNLVRADAEQVANRIIVDEQKSAMAIEENDNIDNNNEDEDEDSDTDNE